MPGYIFPSGFTAIQFGWLTVARENSIDPITGRGLFSAKTEQPLLLPGLLTGVAGQVNVDSASIIPVGTKKTILLIVSQALAWATAGQLTLQPFVSAQATPAIAQQAGPLASSLYTAAAGWFGLTAQNLGASGNGLAIGAYRISATALAELQWPDGQIGIELKFPSVPTAGAAAAYLETG